MIRRRTVVTMTLAGVCLLSWGPLLAESVTAELAAGAAAVAAFKLTTDAGSASARQLLAFALAVNPDNDRALLLQAKLDRGQDLTGIPAKNVAGQFTGYVEYVAGRTRQGEQRLLLYKVIELVDPTNEKALLELARAKQKGVDTEFEALLRATLPDKAAGTAADRRQDNGGAVAERRKASEFVPGKTPIWEALRGIEASEMAVSYGRHRLFNDPMHCLNSLNQALYPAGCRVRIESAKRRIDKMRDAQGMRYYSDAFRQSAYRVDAFNYPGLPTGIQDGEQLLLMLCALHNLAWKNDGAELTLVEPAESTGDDTLNPIRAGDLASALKRSHVDFLNRYKGKKFLVHGIVSGVGKSGGPYVHLANDVVRIIFELNASDQHVQHLRTVYRHNEKQERSRRETYGRAPVLLFSGEARCHGIMRGKIILKDCRGFAFLLARPR